VPSFTVTSSIKAAALHGIGTLVLVGCSVAVGLGVKVRVGRFEVAVDAGVACGVEVTTTYWGPAEAVWVSGWLRYAATVAAAMVWICDSLSVLPPVPLGLHAERTIIIVIKMGITL
jgi:hypothetical protein